MSCAAIPKSAGGCVGMGVRLTRLWIMNVKKPKMWLEEGWGVA